MVQLTQTYDVFLSYNTLDYDAVDSIARRLEKHGLTVFFDRWYLVAGTPWPQELEKVLSSCRAVAILLGPNGIGRWQQREQYLALDRQARNAKFPVIPVLLKGADPSLGFLSLQTWVDLRQGIDELSLSFLVAAIQGNPPGPDLQSRITVARLSICPFRGLRVFREEDAPFFFGRDTFINRLADAVEHHSLIAVIGASGSGKSSVVRAGLLPRLRTPSGKQVWDIGTMVPGDRPLQNLAAVFVPLLEPKITEADRFIEVSKWTELLEAGKATLTDIVKRTLEKQPGTDRFMLVVDQWEELYMPSQNDQLRQKFLEEVLNATNSDTLSVVLTIRGDFYDRLIGNRSFSDRLTGDALINISGMKKEELKQVIERPAQKVGLQFETGLVNRILGQVQEQSESLPLLEFVLAELWKKQKEERLTHSAYEKLGELSGAIANYAEGVFTGLTQQNQKLAKNVFLQLVRPGIEDSSQDLTSETDPVRRRIFSEELPNGNVEIVSELAKARLLIKGRSEATGKETIDLVHEALIREWDRLRAWIKNERTFLLWREQLRTLMNISVLEKSRRSRLLRGAMLSEAKVWLQKRENELNDKEKQYIQTSIHARNRQWMVGGVVLILMIASALYLNKNDNSNHENIRDNLDTTNARIDTTKKNNNFSSVDNLKDFLKPKPNVKLPSDVITIRIVVHILYKTREENISESQVRSEIKALNKDFRAQNEDISKVPAPFKQFIGDANIQFLLASTDPQGRPTNGITRTKTSSDSFRIPSTNVYNRTEGGENSWAPDRYLNIWICHIENGYPGYTSSFPPDPNRSQDGVVMNYKQIFRSRLTHEIGHYLGLYHLWGNDDCGNDFVDDTPSQKEPNFAEPAFPHITCGNGPNGDMFMNFMDYTPNTYLFTKGQILRMHQVLQVFRKDLAFNRH